MARTDNLTNFLTDVATAIKNKKGTTDPIPASNFDIEIESISSGEAVVVPYAPQQISFANFNGESLDYEVANLDTKNLTSMLQLFYYCQNVLQLDVAHFNTSQVTNMKELFNRVRKVQKLDLSKWDTSKVTNMESMFFYMEKLSELDISNFNTSNVTAMNGMFSYLSSLPNLDLTHFDTSKVTSMSSMFASSKMASVNTNGWNTSNVTRMDYMFSSVSFAPQVSSFDTSKVTNMSSMFYAQRAAKTLDLSNFDFSNVTSMDNFLHMSYIDDLYLGDSSAEKLDGASRAFPTSLKNLVFFKNYGKGFKTKSNNQFKYKLDFSASSFPREQLLDLFDRLYDLNLTYDVANGGTLYTQQIDINGSQISLLTAEEIAIATNKGWTVL